MTGPAGIVIVGAGHAGGSCAAFLRQYGYEGPLTLIGAEPHPPYQRPPLSKAWLKGEATGDDLMLRAKDYYAEAGIVLMTGTTVTAIDRDARRLGLSNGQPLSYETLILATGTEARRLSVDTDQLCLYLRTLDEASVLKARLKPGTRLGLIGGGYVGLEIAASARSLGCQVTLFERESRLLARVASPGLSAALHNMHLGQGVDLHTGSEIASIVTSGSELIVKEANGKPHSFDLVVAGIGAVACDGLAHDSGLVTDARGIVVDDLCQTSDLHVFAIGDVTSRLLPPFRDQTIRLESVPNALEQARRVACYLTGRPLPALEVPWFWSDQYDAKLQIAGQIRPDVRHVVRRFDHGALSLVHLDADNRLICAECLNAPADFMAAKLLIARAVSVNAQGIADAGRPLKSFLSSPETKYSTSV